MQQPPRGEWRVELNKHQEAAERRRNRHHERADAARGYRRRLHRLIAVSMTTIGPYTKDDEAASSKPHTLRRDIRRRVDISQQRRKADAEGDGQTDDHTDLHETLTPHHLVGKSTCHSSVPNCRSSALASEPIKIDSSAKYLDRQRQEREVGRKVGARRSSSTATSQPRTCRPATTNAISCRCSSFFTRSHTA